ncbi:hypothetical protein O7626_40305 [Micromonospora sp. WMMD1102]|uniref:hypothetical protein n=1 Tax=Micromonospora sp. WMMD1102 TaxID=3016105 RepID=UPI0024157463|nr:hypothetical protein [Micromonospora sp. WMMD1102]MDG4792061.1 hypothetical protein [Micromonospora sp. WMMD1102]
MYLPQRLAADIAGTKVAIVDLATGDVLEEVDHGTEAEANKAYQALRAELESQD